MMGQDFGASASSRRPASADWSAADAVLTDAAIDQLIFVAGFSTVGETTLV